MEDRAKLLANMDRAVGGIVEQLKADMAGELVVAVDIVKCSIMKGSAWHG